MIGPVGAIRSFCSMATSHEPADSQDDRHVDSSLERTESPDKSPDKSPDVSAAWRVIDANGNRATEGLRVVEDYVRFVLEDAFLSQACKALRPPGVQGHLLACPRSVDLRPVRPRRISVPGYRRSRNINERPLPKSVTANVRRAAEALRTLEEFAKLVVVEAARDFESQRYELYTLEKSILHLRRRSCQTTGRGAVRAGRPALRHWRRVGPARWRDAFRWRGRGSVARQAVCGSRTAFCGAAAERTDLAAQRNFHCQRSTGHRSARQCRWSSTSGRTS